MRNIFELELGHGQTLFEGPPNVIFIYPVVRDKPNTQETGPVLNELYISYVIPEWPAIQIPDSVGIEVSPPP